VLSLVVVVVVVLLLVVVAEIASRLRLHMQQTTLVCHGVLHHCSQ
jgi:hypothetical protein